MPGRRIDNLVVALTCFLVPFSFVAVAEAGKKPDLVPKAAELKGKDFAFIGKPLGVSVEDITANVGKARAGPTLTRYYLSKTRARNPANFQELMGRPVGAVKPGERDQGETESRGNNRFAAGRYFVIACVDAKDQERESDERNNCGSIDPGRFYSTYESWEGSLSGTGPGVLVADAVETWSSTNASFAFNTRLDGSFLWLTDGGSVRYSFSGTSTTGCGTYSGSGTFALDRNLGYLLVNYDAGTYSAAAGPTAGATYDVSSLCGTGSWGAWPTPLSLRDRTLPSAAATLAGAQTDDLVPDVNFVWSLAGS